MTTTRLFLLFCATVGALVLTPTVQAFDWTDTEVQYLRGSQFREAGNPNNVGKQIVTIQHADGHAYGRNFFFIDTLKSDSNDESATEYYGEGYASFSLSKLSGRDWSWGAVRDVNLTAGINYGRKSYDSHSVNPRVLLPGVTVDLNLPGFDFFNVDMLAYVDRGQYAGHDNGCNATTYQVTPSWKLPFAVGTAKFSFEGFVDVIGAHGNCERQVLSQPQLRWDVGNHFGNPGKLFAGIEYQYWDNKYGIQGLKDSMPQALLLWKF